MNFQNLSGNQFLKAKSFPAPTDSDPLEFAHRPDVMWHSSFNDDLEHSYGYDNEQLHVGTVRAAFERRPEGWFHPLQAAAPMALAHGTGRDSIQEGKRLRKPHERHPQTFGDDQANDPWRSDEYLEQDWDDDPDLQKNIPGMKLAEQAYNRGHIVPYINRTEDFGSVSYAATSSKAFRPWSSKAHDGMRLVGRVNKEPKFNEDVQFEQHPLPGMGDDAVIHYTPRSFKYAPEPDQNDEKYWEKLKNDKREKVFDVPLGYHRSSVNQPAPASETVAEREKREADFYERMSRNHNGSQFNLYLGLRRTED